MFYSLLILFSLLVNPDQKLRSSIEEFLKGKVNGYDRLEFTIVKAPEIPGKYEISSESKLNLNGSFAYIPIKIFKSNSSQIQTFVTVKLKLFKTVCFSKTEVEPKQSIEINNIEFKSTEISDLRGTPILSLKELNGLRSRIKIEAGSILVKEMLEEIPVINKGDKVTAMVISGSVKISTVAEAKQEGCQGQTIIIITKDKKQFKARVIDSNNVIIE